MSEQLGLDGTYRDIGIVESRFPRTKSGSLKSNPMPVVYGPGPADKVCGDCRHLIAWAGGKTYYKCEFRRMSHSVTTDHRVNWPTCGKFEADGEAKEELG